jgi:hypothetical protein
MKISFIECCEDIEMFSNGNSFQPALLTNRLWDEFWRIKLLKNRIQTNPANFEPMIRLDSVHLHSGIRME